jgi:hypothetical protein
VATTLVNLQSNFATAVAALNLLYTDCYDPTNGLLRSEAEALDPDSTTFGDALTRAVVGKIGTAAEVALAALGESDFDIGGDNDGHVAGRLQNQLDDIITNQ